MYRQCKLITNESVMEEIMSKYGISEDKIESSEKFPDGTIKYTLIINKDVETDILEQVERLNKKENE